LQLTELVSDAAECTNGFTEQEKVQHLSETTFHVTTAMVKVMEQLAENNDLTKNLEEGFTKLEGKISKREEFIDGLGKKVDGMGQKVDAIQQAVQNRVKRDIRELGWKDTMKLVMVKPWVWIFLAFFVFSPKCIELVQLLINYFGK